MILSKVHSQYGAPMGRCENTDGRALAVKFHIERVRINQGGYDDGGAYWGIGAPLYHAWGETPPVINTGYYGLTDDADQEIYLRAYSREDAKSKVLQKFPRATFYR